MKVKQMIRGEIKAQYIAHMGDDLMVVNAARVSNDKESKWEWSAMSAQNFSIREDQTFIDGALRSLSEKDKNLIKFLARGMPAKDEIEILQKLVEAGDLETVERCLQEWDVDKHWTPFAHPQIALRISAPIFLARQLFKHKIGFVENEISRRYVDSEPEFFFPETWRKKAVNKKQGSLDEPADMMFPVPVDENYETPYNIDLSAWVKSYVMEGLDLYNHLIEAEVCAEQARMILPQNMMTSWYWTGSLAAWARLYKQRSGITAQKEHRILCEQLDAIIRPKFYESWTALTK